MRFRLWVFRLLRSRVKALVGGSWAFAASVKIPLKSSAKSAHSGLPISTPIRFEFRRTERRNTKAQL